MNWPPKILGKALQGVILLSWCHSMIAAVVPIDDFFKDMIVARGKGFEISRSELDKAIITTKANRAGQGIPLSRQELVTMESQILDKMITTRLLLLKSTEKQQKRGEQQAAALLSKMAAQHPTREAFEQALMVTGMSLPYFEEQIKEQSTVKIVIDDDLKEGYLIPDAAARQYYQENQASFTIPDRARVAHLVIPLADTTSGKAVSEDLRKSLNQEAAIIRNQLVAGKSLERLAETPTMKAAQAVGREFMMARGTGANKLEEALFALDEGGVTQVIEHAKSLHLIQLIELFPSMVQPYEEVASSIREQLELQHVESLLPTYLADLKKEANIEILLNP
jgi:parvulin-like peptidyl-prolyl isomerase